MARKFRITEEQYKMALKEGVAINKTQVLAAGNNSSDIETARKTAQENGLPKENFEVVAPLEKNNQAPQLSTTDKQNANVVISENKLITKKQLQENRLKALKKNSELYTVKDFINKFNK